MKSKIKNWIIILQLVVILALILCNRLNFNKGTISLGNVLQDGLEVTTVPSGNFDMKIPDLGLYLGYMSEAPKYKLNKEPGLNFLIGDSPWYTFYGTSIASKEAHPHMEFYSSKEAGTIYDMNFDGFPDEAILPVFARVKLQVWAVDENGSLLKQVGEAKTDNKK